MNNLQGVKVAFFGTPEFALETLRKLKENFAEIIFVVTQPPKPSGRGQKKKYSSVYLWSKQNKIKVFAPKKINKIFFSDVVKKYQIDFIVIVAFGKILDDYILKYPKYMSLNVHASLLPKWRGAAPIQRALLNGDTTTGVSIMRVEKKLDSGPVISLEKLEIKKKDNAGNLHNKLALIGADILIKTIIKVYQNNYNFRFQNEEEATYAKKIEKTETRINWNDSAFTIEKGIRAFSPWPGAWTVMQKPEKNRLKILDCETIKDEKIKDFNNVIGFCNKDLIVRCGRHFLKIKKIQKEGKKIMEGKEFINGYKLKNFFLK